MSEKYYLDSDIQEICNNLQDNSKLFSGKKFLISGANGFLGKYFIKTLLVMNKNLKKQIKILAIDIKFDKCEIYLDNGTILTPRSDDEGNESGAIGTNINELPIIPTFREEI